MGNGLKKPKKAFDSIIDEPKVIKTTPPRAKDRSITDIIEDNAIRLTPAELEEANRVYDMQKEAVDADTFNLMLPTMNDLEAKRDEFNVDEARTLFKPYQPPAEPKTSCFSFLSSLFGCRKQAPEPEEAKLPLLKNSN